MDRYMRHQRPEARRRKVAPTEVPRKATLLSASVHEHYVRAVNSALENGSDAVAEELAVSSRDEALTGQVRR